MQTIFLYIFQKLLQVKAFFVQWKRIFKRILHSDCWGRIFFSSNLIESFLLLAETVTDMGGNQFLRTDLILVETDFFASGNVFLILSQIFFKESLILSIGSTFSVQKNKYRFLLRAFFPGCENYYLNYKEAYLKLLLLLLAIILLDFSDILVNVSSFSV